jgi:predicted patatin/cPLA2 family phospholipase
MDGRYLMYNRQLDYVAQAEREGRCIVIRPEAKIPIGHVSHNPDEMRRVYEMGRSTGEKYWQRIKTFYEN